METWESREHYTDDSDSLFFQEDSKSLFLIPTIFHMSSRGEVQGAGLAQGLNDFFSNTEYFIGAVNTTGSD